MKICGFTVCLSCIITVSIGLWCECAEESDQDPEGHMHHAARLPQDQ